MKLVESGDITINYVIYEYEMDDGGVMYDWHVGGNDSDVLFETVEEAVRDVQDHYDS